MGKKSAPPPPDYMGAAQQQAGAQKDLATQQTWASRPDEYNPWGNVVWNTTADTDPSTGQAITRWQSSTVLDPRLEGALSSQINLQQGRSDLGNSMLPRMQQEFGQPMDWSQLQQRAGPLSPTTSAFGFGGTDTSRQATPDFGGLQGVDDAGTTRSRAEDAIYRSATSRLDPQWDARKQSMESDLANRGISMNSEAYTRAMGDFDRSRNDAYQQAQMGAFTGGGAEAQRDYNMNLGLRQEQAGELGQQFGMGQQARSGQLAAQQQAFGQGLGQEQQAFGQQQASANYQNQLRQQEVAEAMQQRGFSLNEINALLSGQQVQMPNFGPGGGGGGGNAQAPDYMGALQSQYGADLNRSNANAAQSQQWMQGAGALAAMYFSDSRVKRVQRRLGTHPRGFGIYQFRYIGERGSRVGVIAQEVKRVAPELVRSVRGVLQVNYAGL